MKKPLRHLFMMPPLLLGVILGCAIALVPEFSAHAEKVATRIGTLEYQSDYPTPATIEKLRDELVFQSAVQIYLWSYPLATVFSMRDSHYEVGATNTTIPLFENFLTAKQVVPTGNQETIYAYGFTALGDEPMVFEIAPNTLGFIADAWQRPIKDVGMAGPDKGKGGTYIIVPPGYEGEMPVAKDGEYIYQSPTNHVWWLQRGFVVDGDPAPAVKALKTSRIYKLSEAANPPKQHFLNMSNIPYVGMPDRGFVYWEKLAKALQQEPVQERDRSMMAMAANVGLYKDKPFAPDTRTKKILMDAEKVGEGIIRTLGFASTKQGAKVYEDREIETPFITESPYFESKYFTEVYERAAFSYQAMTGAEAMVLKMEGKGSQYQSMFKDANGHYLNGSQSYKVVMPANVPVNNYWSYVVYDVATRSMIPNGTPKQSVHSNMKELQTNEDGTVDIYFGPTAPKGLESNWVKTIPGKGFFLYTRFYGPLAPFFDHTWKPNDVELIQ